MFVHEYQAKSLLSQYDFSLPMGAVAHSADEAVYLAARIPVKAWVVKAQILAGDRGRFGGVRIARSYTEIEAYANSLFGSTLRTPQTGDEGEIVRSVYVEQALEVKRELYLAVLIDRYEGELILLASEHGGSGIESNLQHKSANLSRIRLSITEAIDQKQLKKVAQNLKLEADLIPEFVEVCSVLHQVAIEIDALMIEFNPVAVTTDNELKILDVKMELDDNSIFRHPEFKEFQEANLEEKRKLRAQSGFNYVRLEGDVGLLVGGAGLALATMDLLHEYGCKPANFMDFPPVATRVDIENACRAILSDSSIKALLVNIVGGGLTHCDTVAEGLITIQRQTPISFPVVVRFAGTKKEHGLTLLRNARMPCQFADSMTGAVQLVSKIVH